MPVIDGSIQLASYTLAQWTAWNGVLLSGQVSNVTNAVGDAVRFKIGDGVTAWNSLPYYNPASSSQTLAQTLGFGNTTGAYDIVVSNGQVIKNGNMTLDLSSPNAIGLTTDGLSYATPYFYADTTLLEAFGLGGGLIQMASGSFSMAHGTRIAINTPQLRLSALTANTVTYLDSNKDLQSASYSVSDVLLRDGSVPLTAPWDMGTQYVLNNGVNIGGVVNSISAATSSGLILRNSGGAALLTLGSSSSTDSTFGGKVLLNADAVDALGAVTLQQLNSAITGLYTLIGNYDASSNLWPSTGGSGSGGAVDKGDVWIISVAGTLGGVAVEAGDQIVALISAPGQTASNWNVQEKNLGYTPISNVLNSAQILVGNSSNVATAVTMSGDITISNTGVSAIGNLKVTNGMLAGSIAASKLVGTDIATVGTLTAGATGAGFTLNFGASTLSGSIPTGNTDAKIKGTLGTANRVPYVSASDTLTSSANLTFDGTTLNVGGTAPTSLAGTPLLSVSKDQNAINVIEFSNPNAGAASRTTLLFTYSSTNFAAIQHYGNGFTGTYGANSSVNLADTLQIHNRATSAVGDGVIVVQASPLYIFTNNSTTTHGLVVNTTGVRIDQNQNLHTAPSAALHVVKTTEQLRVGYDASNYFSTTVSSAGAVTFNAVGASAGFAFSDAVTLSDVNMILGTTTGTKFGTATTQKIGFWNAAPVVQYATTGTVTGYTGGGGTALTDSDTFTGSTGSTAYTIGDIVKALKTCGIIAS